MLKQNIVKVYCKVIVFEYQSNHLYIVDNLHKRFNIQKLRNNIQQANKQEMYTLIDI